MLVCVRETDGLLWDFPQQLFLYVRPECMMGRRGNLVGARSNLKHNLTNPIPRRTTATSRTDR